MAAAKFNNYEVSATGAVAAHSNLGPCISWLELLNRVEHKTV